MLIVAWVASAAKISNKQQKRNYTMNIPSTIHCVKISTTLIFSEKKTTVKLTKYEFSVIFMKLDKEGTIYSNF